ncbi:hypothetical protein ECG_07472 [Echinococcus granulosus]|uniref:Expressed conserved protein n=1 Tax=Echinococcus granulosus TaxID=6210 RepID=A0A068WWR1_ECHGR|nr:hypothetical protein ECG_07472 [Echinococcus granulosus]CDS24588.1 expressed conserved protein [Echinococcus granulosus]
MPTSQGDAFPNVEDPPPFLPEHEGYTLLENSNTNDDSTGSRGSGSSSENEENDTAWSSDSLNDAAVDEALRRALNSDEGVFRTFPTSAEPEYVPDESSPALLWRTPMSEEDRRIPLPEEKAAEIKACLRNFQLPDANLPAWAKQIPEEVLCRLFFLLLLLLVFYRHSFHPLLIRFTLITTILSANCEGQ